MEGGQVSTDLLTRVLANRRLAQHLIPFLGWRALPDLRLVSRQICARLDSFPEHYFPEYDRFAFRPSILHLELVDESEGESGCSDCKARDFAESAWKREKLRRKEHTTDEVGSNAPIKPDYLSHCYQRGTLISAKPATEPQPAGTMFFCKLDDWTFIKTRFPACVVRCQGCRNHRIRIIRKHPQYFQHTDRLLVASRIN
jgi:hypothetical protein